MPLPTATVQIDWNDDGTLAADDAIGALWPYTVGTGPDGTIGPVGAPGAAPVVVSVEDVTAHVLRGLVVERGRNQIKSLSPPLANDLQGALHNASGDYSPDNALSPFYPNVDVGRRVRYALTHAGTTYEVLGGHLDQIAPDPDWDRREVALAALSQLARLVRKDGFSSELYQDIAVGDALGVVFDLAEIPVDRRAFDAGQTRLAFFWVRPDDELFDLAIRLWASEGPGSRLYDGADGVTYFTNRHAQATDPRSTAVQATYRDDATEPYYTGWEPDAGESSVVNRCSVQWVRRAVDAADDVIWTYGGTVTLAPGESRSFRVQPASDDPIVLPVAPIPGTDYTLAAGSLAAASFDRISGAFVTWTVTAGASGATLTGLQIQGKLARVVASMRIEHTTDTQASVDRYGPKPYTLPTFPEVDALVLQDFCNAVVALNQLPRPMRTLAVPLVTDGLIAGALAREVGDRVRVVNARESFDRGMFVESVRVAWPARGAPTCYLGCEAAVDVSYFVLGTSILDGPAVLGF